MVSLQCDADDMETRTREEKAYKSMIADDGATQTSSSHEILIRHGLK